MKGPDIVRHGRYVASFGLPLMVMPAPKTCETMMCSDGGLEEGMTIDLDAVERSNYRFVANSQLVQYSGTADLASLELTTNTPEGVAGTWSLDVRKRGGRSLVESDAVLVKELKK